MVHKQSQDPSLNTIWIHSWSNWTISWNTSNLNSYVFGLMAKWDADDEVTHKSSDSTIILHFPVITSTFLYHRPRIEKSVANGIYFYEETLSNQRTKNTDSYPKETWDASPTGQKATLLFLNHSVDQEYKKTWKRFLIFPRRIR